VSKCVPKLSLGTRSPQGRARSHQVWERKGGTEQFTRRLTTRVVSVHPDPLVMFRGPMSGHPFPAHSVFHIKRPVRVVGLVTNCNLDASGVHYRNGNKRGEADQNTHQNVQRPVHNTDSVTPCAMDASTAFKASARRPIARPAPISLGTRRSFSRLTLLANPLGRVAHHFARARSRELFLDVGSMRFDGLLAQVQFAGDFVHVAAFTD